ncbi:carboxylesterase/lipase family protein [Novosphingopyxis iocasae]|uniref:carboxylesterase/lipase family protein n=1 Tax=Novosphingopyxis iocasae TaxID=2762729 RepID=UPI0016516E0B|nr:carboxylesterase family protein [Novosphingopyxis iocasae]
MKRSLGLACALIVTACTTPGEVQRIDSDLVRTTSGSLRGSVDDGVRVYRGVPYAQPPVGEGRWAAPRTPRWEGVRDAFAFGPACLQPINADGSPNFGGYHGPVSEDCLTLNIWAPKTGTKAPIMLWLFGGGGVVGAGSLPTYNGTAFARDGVILVTINYRLGGLGGFAHPALTREKNGGPNANYALLDAIAALRWVKENAEAFGGDPRNITLFGESAGATMTANLVTSPIAKGLFSKAIIESTGSLPTPATPLAKAEAIGAKVASDLGLPGADATSAQLRALDAGRFLEHKIGGFGFRTISDGVVQPGSIMDAFEKRAENDVMLMLGTNSDEGRLAGTQRVAALAEGRRPVFQYFFDYVPSALRSEHPNGAPHAGELPFVFDTLDSYAPTEDARPTEEDRAVARLVHSCWVAFAKANLDARELDCGGTFRWLARSAANDHVAALLKPVPELVPADTLRSPPNGAEPGKTSRP